MPAKGVSTIRGEVHDVQIRKKLPPIRRAAVGVWQNNQHGALAETGHFRMTNLKDRTAAHHDPHGFKRSAAQHGPESF
jgi:hypothetical protein